VNFITAHDGFTLRDLVSYNDKHNDANGEENRDGESHNRSWNHGVEGPTDDAAINRMRAKQQRNFLVTLFLSQGVPMLLAGDEIGRTQGGNNNAYCQDNEISWVDWESADAGLLAFTQRLSEFRHKHPVFRRRRWFQGRPLRGTDAVDIGWFTPSGEVMSEEDWRVGFAKSLAVFLNGQAIPTPNSRGERVVDDTFLILFNAHHEPMPFRIPQGQYGQAWQIVLDTNTLEPVHEAPVDESQLVQAGASVDVAERAVVVLKRARSATTLPVPRAITEERRRRT
jgi:glycogen operon protein